MVSAMFQCNVYSHMIAFARWQETYKPAILHCEVKA